MKLTKEWKTRTRFSLAHQCVLQIYLINAYLRLIIDGVKSLLQCVGLPPACSALVWQQVEPDEGVRAVLRKGYEVTVEVMRGQKVKCQLVCTHVIGMDRKGAFFFFFKQFCQTSQGV